LGYTYGNPHFEKRSLASLLIKNGRAGYKTDNHPTTDLDIDKSVVEQPIWRQEAFKQFRRLAESLNLDLRQTPSGGLHLIHHRIKGQSLFKSSNLYFHGKAADYQSLHIGEFKAQGGLVVHPLSKDYLPKLNKEFLLNWRKKQKKAKKFAYLTEQQRDKIYSRFGFYFNNLKNKKVLVKPAKIALIKVKKPNLNSNSYLIPKITGKISVKNSQLGKSFDTYQQVIYTDFNNRKYSVLFNCESNLSKQYFLTNRVGNFATTFYLQASRQGSFIKNNFSP
jgi:hypothetical protein